LNDVAIGATAVVLFVLYAADRRPRATSSASIMAHNWQVARSSAGAFLLLGGVTELVRGLVPNTVEPKNSSVVILSFLTLAALGLFVVQLASGRPHLGRALAPRAISEPGVSPSHTPHIEGEVIVRRLANHREAAEWWSGGYLSLSRSGLHFVPNAIDLAAGSTKWELQSSQIQSVERFKSPENPIRAVLKITSKDGSEDLFLVNRLNAMVASIRSTLSGHAA
jgi:hypothetical protein